MVKTRRFGDPVYLGDPLNCVRILNDKEVDELIVLDITASGDGRSPDVDFLASLAGECFMPVCYGGGIRTVDDVERVLRAGFEKVAVNTAAFDDPAILRDAAAAFGRQAVVGAFDVTSRRFGGRVVARTAGGVKATKLEPREWAQQLASYGAGELLVTSIDRDGGGEGYDLVVLDDVLREVEVPVLVSGGAGSIDHIAEALARGASGAVAGRLFLTRGQHFASLVSYPPPEVIDALPRQESPETFTSASAP
jgi:cyclase